MLARWRETGAWLGVCVSSVCCRDARLVVSDAPLRGFAVPAFAVGLGAAGVFCHAGEWRQHRRLWHHGYRAVLLRSRARRALEVIALFHAAPR